MKSQKLKEKIDQLPPLLQQEAYDFVDFLWAKTQVHPKKKKQLNFEWEGILSDLKPMSAIDLQKKSMDWR